MLRDIYNQADNTDTDHYLKIPFQKLSSIPQNMNLNKMVLPVLTITNKASSD